MGGFPNRGDADSRRHGGCRDAICGEITGRLFGRRASGVGPAVEDRQPEPAAVCRWLRSRMAWIGDLRRRSGAWTGRRCAIGFIASTLRVRMGSWTAGPKVRSLGCRKSSWLQLARIVEVGPDREKDGVVRWRRIDLKRVIAEKFGVDFHPRYVGKASAQARLLAHQRKATSSGAGRTDRRGV